VNGLGSVMRFVTTGAAGGSGLGAAQVFSARKFVAGVIDHFIRLHLGRSIGAKLGNLFRDNDQDKQHERFQQQRSQKACVGENTVRGFAGQARAGAGEGGTDGGDEILPSRRPLDQELGRVVQITKLDRVFELERIGH
jgi:hypothetical protein